MKALTQGLAVDASCNEDGLFDGVLSGGVESRCEVGG